MPEADPPGCPPGAVRRTGRAEIAPGAVPLPVGVHRVAREHHTFELLAGTMLQRVGVDTRVDQHLGCEWRAGVTTQAQRHRGGEVSARALPRDRDTTRWHAELRHVRERPPGDRLAVVEARRVRVLGRQAVLDRDHCRAGSVRELAGDVVHEPDAADAEPAAVEVDDQARGRRVGLVEAHRDPVDGAVGDARRCPATAVHRPDRGRARASRGRSPRTADP